MTRELHLEIASTSAKLGRIITMTQWADRYRIPDRREPGQTLSGERITEIIGIESKSWDPDLFRSFATVVAVAVDAIARAELDRRDIDVVVIATCTPYETHLDQDAFRLMRELALPDEVMPLKLEAGCAGFVRAVNMLSRMDFKNALIVSYNVPSLYMDEKLYTRNAAHPMADYLWMSPALFSDAATAVVVRRTEQAKGQLLYSRDALSFGDLPGFTDSLIHYLGGGAWHPPGSPHGEALACYGMSGRSIQEYYSRGMLLNHLGLLEDDERYFDQVKRIYTHQASPRLVEEYLKYFHEATGIDTAMVPTNVKQVGNTVTPSTMVLLHDDLENQRVKSGDKVCISVVGSGPERGAFVIPIR